MVVKIEREEEGVIKRSFICKGLPFLLRISVQHLYSSRDLEICYPCQSGNNHSLDLMTNE